MWAILWHDLKKIFTNPVAIIITIGITILPSAYAWLNIISNWDPYANTRHISVAVANLDVGASSQLTGEVNVGEQVVSQLKENDQLGWTFVKTRKEAVEGIESGRYYAAVVIDKNFSRSLVRMLTSGGSRPELNYYVNEKLNPIAPKITDSGATALDNLLNATFIGTASTAVSDQLNISTDKAKSLIEGAHAKTISKLDDLMTTLSETKDGLEHARTALDETADKTHSVQQAVNDTKAAVDSARKAANQAARTASASSTAASGFSNNVAGNLASSSASLSLLGVQVGQAGTTISSSLSTANADVATVNARLNTLLAKNDAAVAALSSVLDNSTLDKNSDAYKQLESTLSDLQTLNKQQHDAVNNFSQKAQESLSSAQDSVSNLSSTLSSSALSSASSFQSLSASLNGSLSTSLTGSIDAAGSLASVSAASLGQVSSSLEQSNNVVAQLRSLLQQTSSTIQASENSIEQVCTHINTVRTDFAALDSSALAQRLRDTNLDANAIGSFMQKPVELEQKSVYPVHNYGSAIAPFFTNIALWVGGFVLIAVMKIEVDASSLKAARRARKHKQAKSSFAAAVRTRVRNSEAFMGRWLLFALLGAAQGFVATVGDLIIGIQVEHPVAFVCAGMFASVVYVTVIMALAATLRHIGKALAVILVVMCLVRRARTRLRLCRRSSKLSNRGCRSPTASMRCARRWRATTVWNTRKT